MISVVQIQIKTGYLLVGDILFNCFATVENPRFYRGKKKA